MRAYVIKRLLWMLPTLAAITLLSYAMMRVAPGDPVKASMLATEGGGEGGGVGTRKEGESTSAREFRRRFHLDRPWYVGYWRWLAGSPAAGQGGWIHGEHNPGMAYAERGPLAGTWRLVVGDPGPGRGGLAQGDFGVSVVYSLGKPVWDVLRDPMIVTIKLNLWAMAVIYLVAIPFGLYTAVFRGSWADRGGSLFFFVLYCLPSYWIGLLLIIAASQWLPAWPIRGIAPDTPATEGYWAMLFDSARHYVLPVICMSLGGFAELSRFARSGVLEAIRKDYVRTARAKGLSEWTVMTRHVFRNSLITLVTLFGGMLPGLLGGSVLVEYLFSIPGMGNLMQVALSSRDYPLLMTQFGLGAFLLLVGVLLSDILYAVVDPRIRYA